MSKDRVSIVEVSGWQYREAGSTRWKNSRPGSTAQIQTDLLDNGEIPDWNLDMNIKKIQWVAEKDWEYRASFVRPEGKRVELVFEGLDTFASVKLNGVDILETDNMFLQYSVDVTDKVQSGANELQIYFKSALLEGRHLEKLYGVGPASNGEDSRLQVRKAQYGWGWDWGDIVLTCGPWLPVKVVGYAARLADVHVDVDLSDLTSAAITVSAEIEGSGRIDVKVHDPAGKPILFATTASSKATSSTSFKIGNPELWYPNGMGKQPLYTFTTTLTVGDGTALLDQRTQKVGLRRIELIQEPYLNQEGTSFFLRVNGEDVYAAGSDWIPAHSVPVAVTKDKYKDLLGLAAKGNQNIIRVWGGGYYEDEVFYDECDRLGLMVWQDFMFACGIYPAHAEFVKNVSAEVACQLKRLRNHCCMAIYAGNNEDYQVAEHYGIQDDITKFPARRIYESTLPALVKKYSPEIPYHPGSPWGGQRSGDPTIGDIHQWNVWHGAQEPYQNWPKLGGRFVSEFGMESLSHLKSYETCITDKTERYPQSETIDFHNKTENFMSLLSHYVMDNIKLPAMDLDGWIYASQLMQAECLSYAYKSWRRDWRTHGERNCSGTIVWQLDDSIPVASWSIIDFYHRPKLAYYAVKRECSPISLGLYREDVYPAPDVSHDYGKHEYTVDIWGVNSTLDDVKAHLHVDLYEVESGNWIKSLPPMDVVLVANECTEFISPYKLPTTDTKIVVYARLLVDGKPIATASDWPQPLKHLKFPDRTVTFKVGNGSIRLSANKPVKGVEVSVEGKDVIFDDNGFDIFPTEAVVIKGNVKEGDPVNLRYYQ